MRVRRLGMREEEWFRVCEGLRFEWRRSWIRGDILGVGEGGVGGGCWWGWSGKSGFEGGGPGRRSGRPSFSAMTKL